MRWNSRINARIAKSLALFAAFWLALAHAAPGEDAQWARERAAMVETIKAHALVGERYLGGGGISPNVLAAMAGTERHRFVPEQYRALAYTDRPLPIGHGQTISQPFIVALMTHLAAVKPGGAVLEIGTGSGYQAAILSPLAGKVCTIEIVRPLGEQAQKRLAELGYGNVRVRIGDGYQGWPECGPFDAIIVTAALGHIPPPLIAQLKDGGRLVMPVGEAGRVQQLTVAEKTAPDKTQTRTVIPVVFVPFTRSEN